MSEYVVPLLLTLGAGLSTAIGGLIAVAPRRTHPRLLPVGLGFSAGVMLYVSFMELLPSGIEQVETEWSESGAWLGTGAFFAGVVIMAVIDRVIPEPANPHEYPDSERGARDGSRLMRMGLLTALAIGIHNLPEGFATFVSALESPDVALPVAIAIAIHNIPEGLAVAVPIKEATGDRGKALRWAVLSGFAEPTGAVVGYLLLSPFLGDAIVGITLCAVAGVMVFISLDELLPTAEEYGEHHATIYGLVAGMAVMAVSLLLLA